MARGRIRGFLVVDPILLTCTPSRFCLQEPLRVTILTNTKANRQRLWHCIHQDLVDKCRRVLPTATQGKSVDYSSLTCATRRLSPSVLSQCLRRVAPGSILLVSSYGDKIVLTDDLQRQLDAISTDPAVMPKRTVRDFEDSLAAVSGRNTYDLAFNVEVPLRGPWHRLKHTHVPLFALRDMGVDPRGRYKDCHANAGGVVSLSPMFFGASGGLTIKWPKTSLGTGIRTPGLRDITCAKLYMSGYVHLARTVLTTGSAMGGFVKTVQGARRVIQRLESLPGLVREKIESFRWNLSQVRIEIAVQGRSPSIVDMHLNSLSGFFSAVGLSDDVEVSFVAISSVLVRLETLLDRQAELGIFRAAANARLTPKQQVHLVSRNPVQSPLHLLARVSTQNVLTPITMSQAFAQQAAGVGSHTVLQGLALGEKFEAEGKDLWSKGPDWPLLETAAPPAPSPTWTFGAPHTGAATDPVGFTTVAQSAPHQLNSLDFTVPQDYADENSVGTEQRETSVASVGLPEDTDTEREVEEFLRTIVIRFRRQRMKARKGKRMGVYYAARSPIGLVPGKERFASPDDVARFWIARGGWKHEGFMQT